MGAAAKSRCRMPTRLNVGLMVASTVWVLMLAACIYVSLLEDDVAVCSNGYVPHR